MLKLLMLTSESCKTWFIAFSGGLDSTVLLHMHWQQKLPVHAIHINHQLQSQSDQWAEHCAEICIGWKIPYTITKVNAKKVVGASPEATARAARYAVFKELVIENTVICTAHHQDDQAETVLLQLLRGAGVAGLSAMPEKIPFGKGFLLRPLLNSTREQLQNYAKEHQLKWIDDPSNEDRDFDRNFLRHEIFPLLQKRWPSASRTIARSAAHCGETIDLIKEITQEDYVKCCSFPRQLQTCHSRAGGDPSENRYHYEMDSRFGGKDESGDNNDNSLFLRISQLKTLSPSRKKNVIRYWIEQCGLSSPSTAHLEQIYAQLLHGRADANPLVQWPGGNVRRYRDNLYAELTYKKIDLENIILSWDLAESLTLPAELGILTATSVKGHGFSKEKLKQAPITIRFRQGGERCQPLGRAHSQVLKKLWQEYGIPTWERNQIPLLFCGTELAGVIGHWICTPFAATKGEDGWEINKNLDM